MCIKKGINIADICSAALEKAAFSDYTSTDPLFQERERLAMEVRILEKKEQEVATLQAQHDLEKQKTVEEFLNQVSDNIVNDDVKLAIWVQKTGLSPDELKTMKFKKITSEMGQKKVDKEQMRLRAQYAEDQRREKEEAKA